jgi:hypothetical protein
VTLRPPALYECFPTQTCRRLQRVINGDEQGWEKRCRRDWGIVDLDPVTVPCLDTMLLTNLKSLGGPLSGGASLSGGVGTSNGTSSTRHLGASQSWNTGGLPGTRGSAVGMAGGASERISRVSDSGGGGVPGAASRAVEAVAMEQQQQQQQGRGQQASSSSPAGSGNSGSAGGSAHQQLGSSGGRAVDVGHSSAGGGSGPPSSTTSPRPVLGSLPSPGKGNPTSPGSSSKSFQDRSSHGGGVDRMVGLMGSSLGTIREWQQLGGGWDAHDFLRDLYGASSGTTSLRSSSMHRRLHCTASTTSTGAAGGATSVQAGPASSGTAAQQSSNPPQGGAAGDQDGSAAVAEGGLGGDEGAMTTNIWRHIYKDRAQASCCHICKDTCTQIPKRMYLHSYLQGQGPGELLNHHPEHPALQSVAHEPRHLALSAGETNSDSPHMLCPATQLVPAISSLTCICRAVTW